MRPAPSAAAPSQGLRAATGRWAWFAVILLLAGWGVALGLNPRRAGDLRLYALAARRFWAALPLYPASDGLISFKYSPAAAWLFTPVALLPPEIAGAAWNLASVAAFAFAAASWRTELREDGRFAPSQLALVAATLALGQSLFLELFYGQVNLWMLALLLVPILPHARSRQWLTGLSLAVAVAVKPTAALLAVALLAAGRARALAWALGWGLVLHAPLLARYGWQGALGELRAWSVNLDRTTLAWMTGHNPQGLPTLLLGAVYPLDAHPPRALAAAAEIFSAVLVLAAAFLARLRGASLWCILCLGVALVSPLAWRANFVLAWPMLVAVLSVDAPAKRRAGAIAVAAIAAVQWTASEAVLGPAAARALLATHLWGLVFLVAAAVAIWALPKGEPAPSAIG